MFVSGCVWESPMASVIATLPHCHTGAQRGARTHDPEIKSLMLYRTELAGPGGSPSAAVCASPDSSGREWWGRWGRRRSGGRWRGLRRWWRRAGRRGRVPAPRRRNQRPACRWSRALAQLWGWWRAQLRVRGRRRWRPRGIRSPRPLSTHAGWRCCLRTRRLRDVGRLVVYLCSAKIIKVIKDTDLRPCVQRKNPTVTRRVCHSQIIRWNVTVVSSWQTWTNCAVSLITSGTVSVTQFMVLALERETFMF